MRKRAFNIAIVGATGVVGETLLLLLEEREFRVDQLFLLASEKSLGKTLSFRDQLHLVEPVDQFDFSKADIAFFAAGNEISLKYVPMAESVGCIVIDKSSAFRYDKKVPLIVPEVNLDALNSVVAGTQRVIANPNCNTLPFVVALNPIHDRFKIARVNIATYQSVSGVGKKGIEALAYETAELLSDRSLEKPTFEKQIAFNVIPKIDDFCENGYTLEEMKVIWETQKILDPKILVNVTTVRVPVFFGHSAAVHIETKKKCDIDKVIDAWKNMPSIVYTDHEAYPTPITEAANHDGVFVGRLRHDISHKKGLNCWVVSYNVRKGAALNAIQIAEHLVAVK